MRATSGLRSAISDPSVRGRVGGTRGCNARRRARTRGLHEPPSSSGAVALAWYSRQRLPRSCLGPFRTPLSIEAKRRHAYTRMRLGLAQLVVSRRRRPRPRTRPFGLQGAKSAEIAKSGSAPKRAVLGRPDELEGARWRSWEVWTCCASAGCSGPSPEPRRSPVTHPTRLSPCLDTNSGRQHEVAE